MTPDAILREWFQKVWNEGDEKSIARLAHPDVVVHGLSDAPVPVRGLSQFMQFHKAFRSAIPDVEITVERTVSEGAFTTGHCRVTGHHTGAGLQIAATNKPIQFEGACILRIANGMIVEAWNFFDFLSFYQQVGALSTKA